MTRTLTFENGLTLLCAPNPQVAGVSFELFLPAGALTEPTLGSSSVLEEWLWRGAGELDSRALEDALDAFGARRESEVNLEGLQISLACLPEDAALALALLSDLVRRPHLDESQFAACLMQARAALEGLEDAPDEKLFTLLSRRAFGSDHGRSPFGSLEGLDTLTPEGVREDWRRRFTPRGSLLAVSGNLAAEAFFALAAQHFLDWQGEAIGVPPLEFQSGFQVHHTQVTAQTHMALIYPSVAFAAPGYYGSRFVVEALSGAQSSRLFNEVRERRGLAYSVYANTSFYGLPRSSTPGSFGTLEVYAATTPERASETLEVLLMEMQRLEVGLTPPEFARARTGILTSLALFEEASSARAASLIRDYRLLGRVRELEEIGAAVRAVRLEDVNDWLASAPYREPGIFTLGQRAP